MLVVLLLFTPRADAATPIDSYAFTTTFGDGLNTSFGPAANGVTVEASTGNILVAEGANSSVSVYAPDPALGGVPLTTFVDPFFASGINLASDPSNGSVYVVDSFSGGVTKWVSDGAPTPTYTIDGSFSFFGARGVAVDPVTHDVLVTDLGTTVSRVDSGTGAVLSTFTGSDTRGGTFSRAEGLAVGPTGTIYVVDTSRPRVEQMSSGGAAQGALPLADGGKPIAVAVNGQSGEVAVVESLPGGRYVLEGFTPGRDRVYSTPLPSTVTTDPVGLAVDPSTGRIYLADGTGIVFVFDPAIQPGIDAPVVSQIAGDQVHVSAVIAAGGETTTARIEYCPASADCAGHAASDPSDPSNPWIREPDHTQLGQTGDPAAEETIADDITGLSPNTTYRVRVHAENALTENTSPTTTFTTAVIPPDVQTGPASDVTASSAVLAGTIDTIGDQTTYHFEYGLTDAYGNTAPSGAEGIAGNDRTPRTFTRSITGLKPGTTYHYRLVAQNSGGRAVGADRTFTTLSGDTPARGYEQVTPIDKRGATVNPTFGFHAAADGSGLEYTTTSGSSDANSAAAAMHYLSRRDTSDWSDWNLLDPPMAVSREIVVSLTLAVSGDFDHTMVVSNRALTPGAVPQAANIYTVDLRTGAYTLIGTGTAPSAFLDMVAIGKSNMFLAGERDFSWIVFASKAPLLQGVTAPAIYRWTRGEGLTLESRLPDGTVPAAPVWMQTDSVLSTRVVSDDGGTTYFTLTGGPVGVYRRANGVTKPISVSHRAGDPPGAQFGFLDGISSDGRYAFFHGLQLTDDAPPAFGNLYRYDSLTDELTYIATLSLDGGGDGTNDVQGVSADGRTVYYHSGSHTMVWHDGQEHQVDPQAVPTMFPSRNGHFVAYQRGVDTGDVRLYDLARQENTCISCPVGGVAGAGNPSLPHPRRTISNRVPVAVTDQGLAFFDSTARLVAADRNGTRDVYAYQDGTVTLVSPGDQAFDAYYADASEDGHDVFFGTAQALVGRDADRAVDIYDARIGGGFPSPPSLSPAPCSKNECSEPTPGPVTSPPVVTPPDPPGPAKRGDRNRVTVKLAKVRFTSTSIHIRFRASEQGRVRVTGVRVRTTVRNVSKAGTYSIVVPLSRKARALRHDHRRFKVAVKVTLTGGWESASAKYSRTFGK
jgi:DNA-binding beta-propeller fold protein YncE